MFGETEEVGEFDDGAGGGGGIHKRRWVQPLPGCPAGRVDWQEGPAPGRGWTMGLLRQRF